MIAAGRFFGMKLPENFNRPYLARNVIEFWTRWHITLGTWIRDYLFLPMYKPVVERWPKRAPSLAWIFYFLAFAVAGAWHGTTLNYLFMAPGRAWVLGDEAVRELAARAIRPQRAPRIPPIVVDPRGGDLPEPAVSMRLVADLFAAGCRRRVADGAKSVLHPDGTFLLRTRQTMKPERRTLAQRWEAFTREHPFVYFLLLMAMGC